MNKWFAGCGNVKLFELHKNEQPRPYVVLRHQGLYSLSGKTYYYKISWSLEAARLDAVIIVSLWNLTGISTVNINFLPPGIHGLACLQEKCLMHIL